MNSILCKISKRLAIVLFTLNGKRENKQLMTLKDLLENAHRKQ